jgi:hypothetical protein
VFKAACAGYCIAVDAAAHTTVLLLTPKSPGRKPSKRSELTSSPVFVCVCVGTTVPISYSSLL